jgi:ABC transport system ATP-binding/permease protein
LCVAAVVGWRLMASDAPTVTPVPVTVGEPQPAPSDAPPTATEPPTVEVASDEQKLKAAQTAMEAHDFDRALDILVSIRSADGTRTAEVEKLIAEARSEVANKKSLSQAQKELAQGRVEKASALLAEAQGTLAFSQEYSELKSQVDAAGSTPSVATNPPPTPPRKARTPPPPPPTATSNKESSGPDAAQRFYDDGMKFLRTKRYIQARTSFTRCIQADESMARCHMWLGSTYAHLHDYQTAARYYRTFMKLAPDDPLAPRVKKLLDEYEQ